MELLETMWQSRAAARSPGRVALGSAPQRATATSSLTPLDLQTFRLDRFWSALAVLAEVAAALGDEYATDRSATPRAGLFGARIDIQKLLVPAFQAVGVAVGRKRGSPTLDAQHENMVDG